MGNSRGNLMYIYCDSYFSALFNILQREEEERERERERKERKEKKDCARSAPNL